MADEEVPAEEMAEEVEEVAEMNVLDALKEVSLSWCTLELIIIGRDLS